MYLQDINAIIVFYIYLGYFLFNIILGCENSGFCHNYNFYVNITTFYYNKNYTLSKYGYVS